MERFLKLTNGVSRAGNRNPVTSFTIANNQVASADITGLVFNPASFKAFKFSYVITRSTGSNYAREFGVIQAYYDSNATAWISPTGEYMGDNSGVTFFLTSGGQVQYQSTNIAGASYVGTMEYTVELEF